MLVEGLRVMVAVEALLAAAGGLVAIQAGLAAILVALVAVDLLEELVEEKVVVETAP